VLLTSIHPTDVQATLFLIPALRGVEPE